MKKICLEHLVPGMVLAKNVPGADGGVFLPSGTAIAPDHIEALANLGAGAVYVNPLPSPQEEEQDLLRRVDAHARKFFQYVDPDCDAFAELYRIAVRRTLARAAEGWDLPCESELTAKSVEHMRDLFYKDRGTVEDLVRHETALASFPDIYYRIKEVLDAPASSADSIAKVVGTDLGLSAKLLKLVNSPVFGFSTTIDSVPHAISLIGTRELCQLALGISTINFFKDIPPELIDMKAFWRHSLSCGVFAKLLSGLMGRKSERYFTAGLLHDAGKLIMFKNMPYASVQALLYARGNTVPMVDAEREIFDFDHCAVAGVLLSEWKFPAELTDMIVGHHNPMNAPAPVDAAVLQLADNMANATDIAGGGMYVLPGMAPGAWELLEIDSSKLAGIVQTHDRNIDEVTAVFQ